MALNVRELSQLLKRTDLAEVELASWQEMTAERPGMDAPWYDEGLGDAARAAADARIAESYDRLVAFANWCDTLGDAMATQAATYIRNALGI